MPLTGVSYSCTGSDKEEEKNSKTNIVLLLIDSKT